MEEFRFQYYPARVNTNKPLGVITLDYMLNSLKHPKPEILSVFRQIEQAEIDGNKQLKAELKQNNLYYFTPCVLVHPTRRYVDIKHFTGLMVIDFDHIDFAVDLKTELFREYNQIIAAWLSPSRRGVKCIVRIPVVKTVEQFKEYYFGIVNELDYIQGFDPSGQNAVLPLFQSFDHDLLRRYDYKVWTIKGDKITDFAKAPVNAPVKVKGDGSESETIIKIIDKGFTNIDGFGHPPLRSLCLSIGGYVANGYISQSDAIHRIDWNIENHSYLRKGIEGYKKTARWAIQRGQSKPLNLRHG